MDLTNVKVPAKGYWKVLCERDRLKAEVERLEETLEEIRSSTRLGITEHYVDLRVDRELM